MVDWGDDYKPSLGDTIRGFLVVLGIVLTTLLSATLWGSS